MGDAPEQSGQPRIKIPFVAGSLHTRCNSPACLISAQGNPERINIFKREFLAYTQYLKLKKRFPENTYLCAVINTVCLVTT